MSEQGKTVDVTLTKAELDAMSPEARNNMFLHAFKIKGTAVVKRADGSIKYDDPSRAGEYGESEL